MPRTIPPTSTGYDVTGLDPGSNYEFQAVSTNGNGATPSNTTTPSTSPTASPRYAVIDLGASFAPAGINDSAMVAGNGTNGPAYWSPSQGQQTLPTNYTPDGFVNVVGIDNNGDIAGNIILTSAQISTFAQITYLNPPDPPIIPDPTGCVGYYWANEGTSPSVSYAEPVVLGQYNNSAEPYYGANITAISDDGFMVGAIGFPHDTEFPHSVYVALQFSPSTSNATIIGMMVTPSGAAGTGLWCGYAGYPIIGGTEYTNSSYAGVAPVAINDSSFMAGAQGTNAVMMVPTSSTSLAVTNLGPGSASALNNLHDTNNNPTPQIVGSDNATNGTLWDQTMYDGTPTTNGVYVAKNLNRLIPGGASTNTPPWNLQAMTGINTNGAIIGTANYTPQGTNDTTPAGPHGVMLVPMDLVVQTAPGSGQYQHIDEATIFPADNGVGCGPPVNQDTPKGVFITLNADLTTTAVDSMTASIGGPGGYFSGTLTETAANSGVFVDTNNIVSLTLPVGTTTSPTQIDTLTVTVNSTSLGYNNATFSLVENDVDSLYFSSPIDTAEIIFSNAYNPSVVNSAQVNLNLEFVQPTGDSDVYSPISLTLSETFAGSGVFIDPVSGLTVSLGNYTGSNSSSMVASFSGGVLGSLSFSTTLIDSTASPLDYTSYNTTGDTATVQGTNITPDNPDVTGDGIFYLRVKGIPGPINMTIQADVGQPQQITLNPDPNNPGSLISGKLLLVPQGATGQTSYADITTLVTAGIDADPTKPIKVWNNGSLSYIDAFPEGGGLFLGEYFSQDNLDNAKQIAPSDYPALINGLDSIWGNANPNLQLKGNGYANYALPSSRLFKALPIFQMMYITCHGVTAPPSQIATEHKVGNTIIPAPSIPFQGIDLADGIDVYPNHNLNQNIEAFPITNNIADNIAQNQYDLVFVNGCDSYDMSSWSITADNSSTVTYSGQGLAMAQAFKCRAYIGWTTETYVAATGITGEAFFSTFKGSETVNAALQDILAVNPRIRSYMNAASLQFGIAQVRPGNATSCQLKAYQFSDKDIGGNPDSTNWSAQNIRKNFQ